MCQTEGGWMRHFFVRFCCIFQSFSVRFDRFTHFCSVAFSLAIWTEDKIGPCSIVIIESMTVEDVWLKVQMRQVSDSEAKQSKTRQKKLSAPPSTDLFKRPIIDEKAVLYGTTSFLHLQSAISRLFSSIIIIIISERNKTNLLLLLHCNFDNATSTCTHTKSKSRAATTDAHLESTEFSAIQYAQSVASSITSDTDRSVEPRSAVGELRNRWKFLDHSIALLESTSVGNRMFAHLLSISNRAATTTDFTRWIDEFDRTDSFGHAFSSSNVPVGSTAGPISSRYNALFSTTGDRQTARIQSHRQTTFQIVGKNETKRFEEKNSFGWFSRTVFLNILGHSWFPFPRVRHVTSSVSSTCRNYHSFVVSILSKLKNDF